MPYFSVATGYNQSMVSSHRIRLIREWYVRYERHLSSVALVGGFVADSLTLRRVDLLLENLIFLGYLTLAAAGILFVNYYDVRALRFAGKPAERLRALAPLGIQFAFGALFSGLVVFYFRSSSLGASWPFLLLLAGLLVGNEFFRSRYQKLVFQSSVFFVALFSYLIVLVPVLTGKIGADVFLVSGGASIAVMALLFLALVRLVGHPKAHPRFLMRSVLGIYIVVNALYFANLIPPVPLGLKDAGVYHSVSRIPATDSYQVVYENQSWYRYLRPYDVIHVAEGEPVYVYSAVFAPTNLNTVVYHHWQRFDARRDGWLTTDRLQFPISGGRDAGYRGYTAKTNPAPGRWRVDIITERGQRIGRVSFLVARPDEDIRLVPDVR